jgi:hypothetical protein
VANGSHPHSYSPRHPKRPVRYRRVLAPVSVALAAVLCLAIYVAANRASAPDDPGLLFVIPAGASESVAVPTIDSAIEIPVDIQFGPDDTARITIRNEDTIAHRAGPWVIGAGQDYTARFDQPGVYEFECSVDASESVTVTVAS